jgi:hypothetical protein
MLHPSCLELYHSTAAMMVIIAVIGSIFFGHERAGGRGGDHRAISLAQVTPKGVGGLLRGVQNPAFSVLRSLPGVYFVLLAAGGP